MQVLEAALASHKFGTECGGEAAGEEDSVPCMAQGRAQLSSR